MSDDRCVHAIARDGSEIVRYGRSGKWYVEGGDERRHVPLAVAVRLAVEDGAGVILGLPGGTRFDAYVRRMR